MDPAVAVDAAFERLFGYPWGTTFAPDGDGDGDDEGGGGTDDKAGPAGLDDIRLCLRRHHPLLVEIFGPARAARIAKLPRTGKRRRGDRDNADDDDGADDDADCGTFYYRHPRVGVTVTVTTAAQRGSGDTSSPPSTTRPPPPRRRRITEEDYKSIELPRAFDGGETAAVAEAAAPTGDAASGGSASASAPSQLDAVLHKIAGKKKMNTVEKTSDDWEAFKGEHGQLQDELEKRAQSKDAYLVRQDFLGRVDQRTFELEKQERDQDRARRASAATATATARTSN